MHSCYTHDGLTLETSDRPAPVVVTGEFLHELEAQRTALGLPGLAPVVIDHPLSTISEDEIDARGAQSAEQAVAIWLGGPR